ncbi:DUF3916 domain-containing protein [Gottfriedia solisilvae]|uniref:Group-specific protein n=1 Tax=Gottfriedia solisilvae TaxID=1516104 RepID=A0A8J3AJ80_9BACI|nr:DUF3916 domain-containing protein [Gottfriedia solisilvae]GGI11651.1 hypothetical protein GCM10007380_08910 [Gottfriedia solisilvae]
MREKKIRGIKRKSNKLIKRIIENTAVFPKDFYNERYWHMHLPVSQSFINSKKTPLKIKRLCIQTLIDQASMLIENKPNSSETFRVVVAIDLPDLFSSQIIVFKGDSYFNSFFDRDDEFQKWIPLTDNRNLKSEWNLVIPKEMQTIGYNEIISDYVEDTDDIDVTHEGEIWFIGELN